MLGSVLGLAVLRMFSVIPLPVLSVLGLVLGELIYIVLPSRRRVAQYNINACFPELSQKERKHLAHKHFRVLGQALFGTTVAWWASEKRLRRIVQTRNEHNLKNVLSEGRPVILLIAHFVSLEIGGIYISVDYPLVDIYRKLRNPLYDRVAYRCRSRFQAKLIEMRQGVAPALKAAKTGALFHYLPDQDAGLTNASFVPFFGVPAATMTTLGRLASISGAAVIPCFTRQLPWGRGYEVIFHPPLDDFPSGRTEDDALRMNAVIEAGVREMPEQYFWVHRRFKTRPPEEADFYK